MITDWAGSTSFDDNDVWRKPSPLAVVSYMIRDIRIHILTKFIFSLLILSLGGCRLEYVLDCNEETGMYKLYEVKANNFGINVHFRLNKVRIHGMLFQC